MGNLIEVDRSLPQTKQGFALAAILYFCVLFSQVLTQALFTNIVTLALANDRPQRFLDDVILHQYVRKEGDVISHDRLLQSDTGG